MFAFIILLLVLAYVFGMVQIQIPGLAFLKTTLMVINGRAITWLQVIVLGIILWAMGALPSPLREIAIGLGILWLLGVLGVVTIVWTGNFVMIALVVLLFLAIIMGR